MTKLWGLMGFFGTLGKQTIWKEMQNFDMRNQEQ